MKRNPKYYTQNKEYQFFTTLPYTKCLIDFLHYNRFVEHYFKRGNHESRLKQIATEIAKNEDFHNFAPDKNTEKHNSNSDRFPLNRN